MNPKPTDLAGDWQHLSDPSQRPRYQAIAALVPPRSSVLDVGCGMAVLRGYLPANTFYVGVEPSALARAQAGNLASIYCVRAEDFAPNVPFDRIVMSECCYYMRNPMAIIDRYAKFLSPNGAMIITILNKSERRSLVSKFLRRLPTNRECLELILRELPFRGGSIVRSSVPRPDSPHVWQFITWAPTNEA